MGLLCVAGCEGGSGTLLVQPQLRDVSCAEIDRFRVTLDHIQDTHPCVENDALFIQGLPAREYRHFSVTALDFSGDVVATSESQRLEIERRDTTEARVLVAPGPAQLGVNLELLDDRGMRFRDGETSPVTEIHVLADALESISYSASVTESAYVRVEDPDGSLAGTAPATVRIDVIAGGVSRPVVTHDGEDVYPLDLPGHHGHVSIPVRCHDVRCYFER